MSKKVWMILVVLLVAVAASACGEDAHDHDHENEGDLYEASFVEAQAAKADGNIGRLGSVAPDRKPFGKQVALTFDDGPHTTRTPRVLDTLKAHGIKATFFINGNRVNDDTRPILKRIIEEGHILANHSYNHPNFRSGENMSERNACSRSDERRTERLRQEECQIETTHNIIAELTEPVYFRFPYGNNTDSANNHLDKLGLRSTGWHVDSGDWCFSNSNGGNGNVGDCPRSSITSNTEHQKSMVAHTMAGIDKHQGGIVLFHDIHEYTVTQVPVLIEKLIESGYTFTNIDNVELFPILNGITPAFIGDVCADDETCNYTGGFCEIYPASLDSMDLAGFCTEKCEGFCPDAGGKAGTFCTSFDGGLTGQCVSRSDEVNNFCQNIPGTKAQERDRFIGTDNPRPSTVEVCVPAFLD